eukprot:CAMPEP_0118644142 /NCGR_PEP_ID=MMETSP0785-20121206/6773_1 /TAXON_ID=91992 /ORGANISM="Bolidomonas pacifica, Strain CCMP 1866" /LENGTH=408 /DNA_ID=CAMNT_0006535865 /DNA_START=219 /DNA_END=1445 /DNA_ORIENTATION=+
MMAKVERGDDDDNDDDNEYEIYDYSNPEFEVDQGSYDEFPTRLTKDQTEEEIEKMREERRRKNDEFQFETFYKEFMGEEEEWRGEWTRYETTTFLTPPQPPNEMPKLVKPTKSTKTIITSQRHPGPPKPPGQTITTDHITQSEVIVSNEEADESLRKAVSRDPSTNFGYTTPSQSSDLTRKENAKLYWPEKIRTEDFRGPQGCMCVGNAYTTAWGERKDGNKGKGGEDQPWFGNQGPFTKLNMEVGIRYGSIRMRLKLDYRVRSGMKSWGRGLGKEKRLWLEGITVCRERLGVWPTKKEKAFGGPQGAPGGLFDPPPVDKERQDNYMQLDLEGYATALFPYCITQDAGDTGGWVVSLDWTPGKMRYQADRKFLGGRNVKGLRTLELSEVKSEQAEEYRPRKGPEDMRQ